MLTGTELEILKSVADRGGKSTISIVASKVGMSTDYARICCTSVGNADYIDFFDSGLCQMKRKGWQQLDKLMEIDRLKEAEIKRNGD